MPDGNKPVEVSTPVEETKPTETPVVETPKTMEQIQEETVPEPKETVGLDKFMELKKQNKNLQKEMSDLKKSIEDGATPSEVSADLAAISDKYPDVNKDFLRDLTATIKSQVEKDADKKIEERVKPLEAKEKAKKIDDAFNTHFTAAMANMPEFKDIVNPSVIKTLSLDPANRNKTFSQIIEETYGSALTGKRTIESTIPGGGKDAEALDFTRARKDGAYFDQVMSSPRLKAEYNERMLKEGI